MSLRPRAVTRVQNEPTLEAVPAHAPRRRRSGPAAARSSASPAASPATPPPTRTTSAPQPSRPRPSPASSARTLAFRGARSGTLDRVAGGGGAGLQLESPAKRTRRRPCRHAAQARSDTSSCIRTARLRIRAYVHGHTRARQQARQEQQAAEPTPPSLPRAGSESPTGRHESKPAQVCSIPPCP